MPDDPAATGRPGADQGSRGGADRPDEDRAETDRPDEATVVRTAAEAAEGVVLDRYRQSELADLDVTVSFEDGVLDVDVYLNPGDAGGDAPDPDAVADEAARAATGAVDDLFADASG